MKRIIPILLILTLAAGSYYLWSTGRLAPLLAQLPLPLGEGWGEGQSEVRSNLIGSGFIEADTLTISSEVGGRIIALHAGEGDNVVAGQLLLELDPMTLEAQKAQLEAAIATAKANLEAVQVGPRPEVIAIAEAELHTAETRAAQAELVWVQARAAMTQPETIRLQISQLDAQLSQTEKELELAQVAVRKAEIQAEAASRDNTGYVATVKQAMAQKQITISQLSVQILQTKIAGLKVQQSYLWDQWSRPLALEVPARQAEANYHLAQAGIAVAEANLANARRTVPAEDIAIAQAQVAVAESTLAEVNVQLSKLRLTAPHAGRLISQQVNAGELATPGFPLLTLADLATVTLKVYLPETDMGRVKLGQPVQVTVSSLDTTFAGTVSFIGREAEFTPKNIQTPEERTTLVFAVKVTIPNPAGALKPGMPADALFE